MIEVKRIEKVESFLTKVHDLCEIEASFNTQKLAKQMNVVPTISTVLTNKKITMPVYNKKGVKKWNSKKPDKQMARAVIDELNMYSKKTMAKSRGSKKVRRRLSKEEKIKIVEMRSKGLKFYEIAEQLDRPTKTINNWYAENVGRYNAPKQKIGIKKDVNRNNKKTISILWGMIKIER